jgi:hypothetical protein
MDHPLPWLKYVDADDLETGTVKFQGMDVKNVANDKLGDLNGFIIDSTTGNPYYLVVDSKGWFKTKHYLVPIGHARLDAARSAIVAELTQDQIKKYPGFDLDEFQKWGEAELDRFNQTTTDVCCLETTVASAPAQRWSAGHYRRPDWWESSYYRPERAGESGMPPETWSAKRRSTPADREPALAHDRDKK